MAGIGPVDRAGHADAAGNVGAFAGKGAISAWGHTYVAGLDPLPLELHNAAKDGQQRPAVRDGGVGSAVPRGTITPTEAKNHFSTAGYDPS